MSGKGIAKVQKGMDKIGAPVSLWSTCFLLLFMQ